MVTYKRRFEYASAHTHIHTHIQMSRRGEEDEKIKIKKYNIRDVRCLKFLIKIQIFSYFTLREKMRKKKKKIRWKTNGYLEESVRMCTNCKKYKRIRKTKRKKRKEIE